MTSINGPMRERSSRYFRHAGTYLEMTINAKGNVKGRGSLSHYRFENAQSSRNGTKRCVTSEKFPTTERLDSGNRPSVVTAKGTAKRFPETTPDLAGGFKTSYRLRAADAAGKRFPESRQRGCGRKAPTKNYNFGRRRQSC
jgi:hypothetical protein